MLVADVEELRAEGHGPAQGIVIESHMEKGRGPIAVALVEQGILKSGDFITVGGTHGKIRNLESTDGKPLKQAGPSTPVIITGLKCLPDFGDEFYAVANEKIARDKAKAVTEDRRSGGVITASSSSELLRIINRTDKLNELNVVVKADVQGSLTSVIQSLKALDTEEVATRVVGSGVGVINENDIHLASTSSAIIYGFHTTLPSNIKRLALRDHVPIRLYSVIYELLDDVKMELEKLLAPEIIENELGELLVKGIFRSSRSETICGGEVTKGKMVLPALARVKRGKEILMENIEVAGLKQGPQDVREVVKGELCGLDLKTATKLNIAEGDRIELFTRETKTRTL